MKQSFTISPDTGRAALLRVTDVPNVQHVAVLDAMGLCLMHSGPEPVSTMLMTDWTVVARSAFAACDDLGQRCGAGRCQESLQTHQNGGTLLRAMPGGMLLVIQYGAKTPVGTLRMVAMEVAEALPVPVELKTTAARQASNREMQAIILAGAPNDPFAGESWWSDKVPPRLLQGWITPPRWTCEDVCHGVIFCVTHALEQAGLAVLPQQPAAPLPGDERMGDLIKDATGNRVFATLAALDKTIAAEIKPLWATPPRVCSLVGDGWIRSRANASSR